MKFPQYHKQDSKPFVLTNTLREPSDDRMEVDQPVQKRQRVESNKANNEKALVVDGSQSFNFTCVNKKPLATSTFASTFMAKQNN